ncbi:MAG: hypothetical protein ACE14L_11045 [Terriglobales bacterium]
MNPRPCIHAHETRAARRLAALKPRTPAIMHGSSYSGDGEKALLGLAEVMKQVLGTEPFEAAA